MSSTSIIATTPFNYLGTHNDLSKLIPKPGDVVMCADRAICYTGDNWTTLAGTQSNSNEVDSALEPRSNCINCGAPLSDYDIVYKGIHKSESVCKCSYCLTIQSMYKV